MVHRFTFLTGLLVSVLILSQGINSVWAHLSDDEITSVNAVSTPTIDGVITNSEWGS